MNINFSTLTYNQYIYNIYLVIYDMVIDSRGNVKLPNEEEKALQIESNTASIILFSDVVEMKIKHWLTHPVIVASLTIKDSKNLLINHLNTNRSVLQFKVTAKKDNSDPTIYSGVSNDQEIEMNIDFVVSKSDILSQNSDSATIQLSLISTNWFNFNNNFVYGTSMDRKWIDILKTMFVQNFLGPLSPAATSVAPTILDTRDYTFDTTPSPYITPSNSTFLESMEYILNRALVLENSLFFVVYNPILNNYFLWKLSDDEANLNIKEDSDNVIFIKDRSFLTKLIHTNASSAVLNKSWSGITEIYDAIKGFTNYVFDYSKYTWQTAGCRRSTANLIDLYSPKEKIQNLPGFSQKFVNFPNDNFIIPTESNRFWNEWSESNRQENLWEKGRKVLLENGIAMASVAGSLERIPGSIIYLICELDSETRTTASGLTGAWYIIENELVFTPNSFVNNLYLGRMTAITDIDKIVTS